MPCQKLRATIPIRRPRRSRHRSRSQPAAHEVHYRELRQERSANAAQRRKAGEKGAGLRNAKSRLTACALLSVRTYLEPRGGAAHVLDALEINVDDAGGNWVTLHCGWLNNDLVTVEI